MRFYNIKRIVYEKEGSSKSKTQQMKLRWENWVRVKMYKWIATHTLNENIGVDRANTISVQKLIQLACAKKLNLKIEEETVFYDDYEVRQFIENIDSDLHDKIKEEVERLKYNDSSISMNNWVKEAVLDYMEANSTRA